MNKQFLTFVLIAAIPSYSQWLLPINCRDRSSVENIHLTDIGRFGTLRKARPTVPAHYHTGIDIVRPHQNYSDEPVFPARKGVVASIIDNGPFSQIIIKHECNNMLYWSVYEHIKVKPIKVGKFINPLDTIGYYFNKDELNKYGWQFDHLHFEIIKCQLIPLKPTARYPNRFYCTFAIKCFTKKELYERLVDPMDIFNKSEGTFKSKK
jgi:murein DD-endopeptidase MepM/ murein hydrolase activator NlpD